MKKTDNYRIIDTEYLKEISGNNNFIKKILSLFKENVKVYNEKMPALLSEKKYSELAEIVHKAKSGTAILGMQEQSDSMKKLEFDIKNNKNNETFKERIDTFLNDCNKAVDEITVLEKEL